MKLTGTNQRIGRVLLLIGIALIVVGLAIAPVSAAHAKVMPVTDDGGAKALQHANAHKYIIKTANIKTAVQRDLPGGKKAVDVEIEATPRPSGGITLEMYCRDNVGYYMPVWGASITESCCDWSFALKDAFRESADGCYFAVVDSTAQMEAMT